MSLFLTATFAALLAYVTYRWWATYKWPTVLGGLAIVGLVLSGTTEGLHRWMNHTYSDVASGLAGREATVHCQRLSAALFNVFGPDGFVPYDQAGRAGTDIYLKWEVCKDLLTYKVGSVESPTTDEQVGVHILTHEAMHVSGDTNEASAECKAMQYDALTARALGATFPQSTRLATNYFKTLYPRIEPGYQSTECRPGGELDLRLSDAPWGDSNPGTDILDLDPQEAP